jgi:serine/threonine-protein kinase
VLESQSLPKPGDIVGSKYRIVSSIGAGGMGVVFEAVHVDTEGSVALKWLSPELSSSPAAVERFKVEARATGRIRHPNVVAIHDIAEHNGSMYLVMELLRGSSLRTRLSRGICDLPEALQILFPVMRGVAAAHAMQVLHRDLKPENIFLAESPDGLEPIPKVLDFGIAKLSSDSSSGIPQLSATGFFMGTYPYMSFEQLHARKDLDARVDVYALGAVLYNMLTGELPWKADNPVDLALRMMQSDPEPATTYVPSLPAGLAPVMTRALARERDQRYASVDEFAAALEPFAGTLRYRGAGRTGPVQIKSGEGSVSTPSSPEPSVTPPLATPFVVPPKKTPSRPVHAVKPPDSPRRGLVLGAVAAAVLALGGVIWWVSASHSGDSTAEQHKLVPPPPLPPPPPKQDAKTGAGGAPLENSDWGGDEAKTDAIEQRPSDSLAPGTNNNAPAQNAADSVDPAKTIAKPPAADPAHHHGEPGRSRKDKDKARTVEGTELLAPDWAK